MGCHHPKARAGRLPRNLRIYNRSSLTVSLGNCYNTTNTNHKLKRKGRSQKYKCSMTRFRLNVNYFRTLQCVCVVGKCSHRILSPVLVGLGILYAFLHPCLQLFAPAQFPRIAIADSDMSNTIQSSTPMLSRMHARMATFDH